MEGGCPALVVLLVDGDGGQAATHSPFLIDDNLHPGSKVLLKEMGHSRAPDPSSNNSCQQAQQTKQGRREAQWERDWLLMRYPGQSGGCWHVHVRGRLTEFQRGSSQML